LSVEEIRQRIGADSLHFLTEEGLRRALELQDVCLACFNGRYPAGEPSELARREGLGPEVGRAEATG